MRIGQHLLAGLLLVVGVVRAIMMGDGLATAIVAALAFTGAYWYPVLARRPAQLATPVWLGIVTIVWIGALLASAEIVWLAFLLWLIAGQVLTLAAAAVYSALVFAVVFPAPLLHACMTSYAAALV